MINHPVTNAIQRCSLPSPPSTLLLSSAALRSVVDGDVRTAMVRRILRYVSSHPWGSLLAEARGDRSKLQRIVKRLWGADVESSRGPVTVSGVLWVPLALRSNGRLKTRLGHVGEPVWFIRRQRPEKRIATTSANSVTIDVSRFFAQHPREEFDVLYDNRFALTFSVPNMPEDVHADVHARILAPGNQARVLVEPDTRWYAPRVVLRQADHADKVLAKFTGYAEQWEDALTVKAPLRDRSAWVEIRSIRTLNAL